MNEENSVVTVPDEETVVETGDSSMALDVFAEVSEVETVEVEHPFLTTSFEDYSVSEGLLLVIVLILVVKFCIDVLRRGFYWL